MTNMLEAVGRIVTAHVSRSPMTSEEVIAEINSVHAALFFLDRGGRGEKTTYDGTPTVPRRQAFRKSEVVCMICGKGGMRTLARHLNYAHSMKPKQYRAKFGISKEQPLTARDFSAHRRTLATTYGLADHLVKARAVRAEKLKGRKTAAGGFDGSCI